MAESKDNRANYSEPSAHERSLNSPVQKMRKDFPDPFDKESAEATLRALARRDRRTARANTRGGRLRRGLLTAGAAAVIVGGPALVLSGALGNSEPQTHPASGYSKTVDNSPTASPLPSKRIELQPPPDIASKFRPITDAVTGYIKQAKVDLSISAGVRLLVEKDQVASAFAGSSAIVGESPLVNLSFDSGQTVSHFLGNLHDRSDPELRNYFHATAWGDPVANDSGVDAEFDPTGKGIGDISFTAIQVLQTFVYKEGTLTAQNVLRTSVTNQNQIGQSVTDGETGYNFENIPDLLQRLKFVPLDTDGKDVKPENGSVAKGKMFTDQNGTKLEVDSDGTVTVTYKKKAIQPGQLPNIGTLQQAITPPQEAAVLGYALSSPTVPPSQMPSSELFASFPFDGKQITLLQNINGINRDPSGNIDNDLQFAQQLYQDAAS